MSEKDAAVAALLRGELEIVDKALQATAPGPSRELLEKRRVLMVDAIGEAEAGASGDHAREALDGMIRRVEARLARLEAASPKRASIQEQHDAIAAAIDGLAAVPAAGAPGDEAGSDAEASAPAGPAETSVALAEIDEADLDDILASLAGEAGEAPSGQDAAGEAIADPDDPAEGALPEEPGIGMADEASHEDEDHEEKTMLPKEPATETEADGVVTAPAEDLALAGAEEDASQVQVTEDAASVLAVEDSESGAGRDESLLERLVEEKFPEFNKVARNRFGTGKVLMIAATRNVQRSQRKIEVEVPADAVKWAAGGERETILLVLAKGTTGKHRIITADITTHLEDLKDARARFALTFWDEYGNPENRTASLISGKAVFSVNIDEVVVEDWLAD